MKERCLPNVAESGTIGLSRLASTFHDLQHRSEEVATSLVDGGRSEAWAHEKPSAHAISPRIACSSCTILVQAKGVFRMRTARRSGYRGRWLRAIVIYSFVLLACWQAPRLEGGIQGNGRDQPQTRASIIVERGQLSVDLRQADLRTVLAQIGEQAGITIVMDAKEHRTITAEFTNVEMEAGIRRLLRGTSLSHTILYTREPAGAVAIKEVRVLGGGRGGEPLQPAVAKVDGNTNADNIVSHTALPLTQTPEDSPHPAEAERNDAAASFQEVFELAGRRAPQPASPAAEGEENAMARALQNVLQQQLQR